MSTELKTLKKEVKEIVQAVQANPAYRPDRAVEDIWLRLGLSKETVFEGGTSLPPNKEDFEEDCKRIRDILREHGYKGIGTWDAHDLWKEHSEAYAVSWLVVPQSREEILSCLMPYIKREFYIE